MGLAAPAFAADLPRPLGDEDFISFDPAKAEIGQLLFYDKILSGNRNISCGTCHHHDLGSTDRLSLGIGEGGVGLGPERTAGSGDSLVRKRVPRNAPGLWNLGAKDVRVMFHDGRLEVSDIYGNGFDSPAEEWLPQGLDSMLSAQALFPLTAQFEMAGNRRENDISSALDERIDMAWPLLPARVAGIDEYADMFIAAFDHIDAAEDITIVDLGNAIGAFIGTEFRNYASPLDQYLQGDTSALTEAQHRGMTLFFGEAGCSGCHAGPLLSDQGFHALGLPPFGPGRTRKFEDIARDVGRMGKSDDLDDAYRFRTPMLRNVALTAPYGHNGAYPTLEAMVRHHLDPVGSRDAWSLEVATLTNAPWLEPIDAIVRADAREMARQAAAIEISLPPRTDDEIADLVAFLNALTGETAADRPLGRPDPVPSGLTVD